MPYPAVMLDSADRSEIYNEFFFAVDFADSVNLLLVVSADAASAAADSFTSEVEILADVTYVDENNLLCVCWVSPFGAVHNCAPEECNSAAAYENLLVSRCADNFFHIVAVFSDEKKLVFFREIAVYSALETFNVHTSEVCFERMTCACRWHSTECSCLAWAVITDALCIEKEVGKLFKCYAFLFEKSVGLSFNESACKVIVLESALFRSREVNDFAVWVVRLYKWWLWLAERLVGLNMVCPVVVLEIITQFLRVEFS